MNATMNGHHVLAKTHVINASTLHSFTLFYLIKLISYSRIVEKITADMHNTTFANSKKII